MGLLLLLVYIIMHPVFSTIPWRRSKRLASTATSSSMRTTSSISSLESPYEPRVTTDKSTRVLTVFVMTTRGPRSFPARAAVGLLHAGFFCYWNIEHTVMVCFLRNVSRPRLIHLFDSPAIASYCRPTGVIRIVRKIYVQTYIFEQQGCFRSMILRASGLPV